MDEKQQALAALWGEALQTLTPLLTADQRQVVLAEGDADAPLMLVGEAPGPQEDREGRPFVGPSGKLLGEVLAKLDLRREQLWITNTVKVWPTTRTGRSLRTRPPNAAEKKASYPFFEREVALVAPKVILCLGGTAAQRLIGKSFRITQERGEWREGPEGIPTIATFHPSYILRLQGMAPEQGAQALDEFTADLRQAAQRAGLLEG